ncbi:MAG: hypothetical protein BGO70_06020 [Bacteroidetes bacterium 43-93]|nr:hypothetical protein [Bacteroidota bacterium]OJW97349.1 MAG: hypothetical protein BGO70_06020 [Bacteroidetes bacterium 43-93]
MKAGRAFTSFTRTERLGIISLLLLIAILLAVKATMHEWVHPSYNREQEARLNAQWRQLKASTIKDPPTYNNTHADTFPQKKSNYIQPVTRTEKTTAGVKIKMFVFDPNSVDSIGLRKLGLREKTTAIFLHWRAKGKVFYNKEELKKVYTLTQEDYDRLEPYIQIDRSRLK